MKQEETDMVVSDVVDLTSSLRLSSVDGEELGKERQMLVVGRWLDRAGWVLERLEDEPMGERLAAELLVTWQALYRLADDVVGLDGAERVQLREELERVVCVRREELVTLAPKAFCFAQWRDALAEYVTQVGGSTAQLVPRAAAARERAHRGPGRCVVVRGRAGAVGGDAAALDVFGAASAGRRVRTRGQRESYPCAGAHPGDLLDVAADHAARHGQLRALAQLG